MCPQCDALDTAATSRAPLSPFAPTVPTTALEELNVQQIIHLLTLADFPKELITGVQVKEVNGEALKHCDSHHDLSELGISDPATAVYVLRQIERFKLCGVPSSFLPFTPSPTEIYRIHSVKVPSKCIHLASGANNHAPNGDRCHLWTTVVDSRHHAQEWVFVDGLIKSVKDPTKCIHVMSGSTSPAFNGDLCHLWHIVPGRHAAQEWILDGKLLKSAKCPTKCIHLASGRNPSYNGDVCHLWDIQVGDYAAQEWILVPFSDPPPSLGF
ncbi:hypothetical protein ACHHYP_20470 [Achlya hypogyna]|uniref:Uncharacterized protein n=1 Tax=Achlya hypogyna TaxID=1202772 RepID=A0A1V9YLU7_ACHHY|nr:hypothetical protein ACHHYP_20470 [Achlya hypogyna]